MKGHYISRYDDAYVVLLMPGCRYFYHYILASLTFLNAMSTLKTFYHIGEADARIRGQDYTMPRAPIRRNLMPRLYEKICSVSNAILYIDYMPCIYYFLMLMTASFVLKPSTSRRSGTFPRNAISRYQYSRASEMRFSSINIAGLCPFTEQRASRFDTMRYVTALYINMMMRC